MARLISDLMASPKSYRNMEVSKVHPYCIESLSLFMEENRLSRSHELQILAKYFSGVQENGWGQPGHKSRVTFMEPSTLLSFPTHIKHKLSLF